MRVPNGDTDRHFEEVRLAAVLNSLLQEPVHIGPLDRNPSSVHRHADFHRSASEDCCIIPPRAGGRKEKEKVDGKAEEL